MVQPNPNDGLLREINEAVMQDRLLQFWQRHVKTIILLLGIVALTAAALLFWQYQQDQQQQAESDALLRMAALLEKTGTLSPKEIAPSIEQLAESRSGERRALGKLLSSAQASSESHINLQATDYGRPLSDYACTVARLNQKQVTSDCQPAPEFDAILREFEAVRALASGNKEAAKQSLQSSALNSQRLKDISYYMGVTPSSDMQKPKKEPANAQAKP